MQLHADARSIAICKASSRLCSAIQSTYSAVLRASKDGGHDRLFFFLSGGLATNGKAVA
jgi:hypothetical protein